MEGMPQTSGPTRGRAHTATADVEFLAANANNSLTSKKFLGDNRGKTTNTVWTNKKGSTYEDSYTHPIWGQEEEEE